MTELEMQGPCDALPMQSLSCKTSNDSDSPAHWHSAATHACACDCCMQGILSVMQISKWHTHYSHPPEFKVV